MRRAPRRARARRSRASPIAICCQNGVTSSRFSPLRITPMISAPATTPATPPRPPKKLAPPMMTAVIASSSSSCPAVGEPASVRPGDEHAGDARREAAQHVGRQQHAVDRDADVPRALRVAADGVDPAPPLRAGEQDPGRDRERCGEQRGQRHRPTSEVPSRDRRRQPGLGLRVGDHEREAADDRQRPERDDERVHHRPADEDRRR